MQRGRSVGEALATTIGAEEFTQHYPLEGTVSAAACLLRWGGSQTAADRNHYIACVLARAHRAVPQGYRSWLSRKPHSSPPAADGLAARLWRSIFAVRDGSGGAMAPIAGRHQLPSGWDGILGRSAVDSLERFASAAGLSSAAELIRPERKGGRGRGAGGNTWADPEREAARA